MSSRVQPLQQGDPHRVGPYRVVGRIGSGGMGTVYAALSASGERMAVKIVHPAQAADDEFRARFRREVQLSQRVTGPCLVPVVDADPDAPAPCKSVVSCLQSKPRPSPGPPNCLSRR